MHIFVTIHTFGRKTKGVSLTVCSKIIQIDNQRRLSKPRQQLNKKQITIAIVSDTTQIHNERPTSAVSMYHYIKTDPSFYFRVTCS